MKINKDSLKAKANNITTKLNIPQNIVYNRFFYDSFLLRLSNSKYNNKFILKGGLYLSSLLGVEVRNTMDIDFYLSKIAFEKEKIVQIVKEITEIKSNDNITYEIIKIDDIRKDDVYGGFQITLLGKLENVRCQFTIDVATGDPIIPSEKNYNYECLVTKEIISLKVYSLESVIAEKLETLLRRGLLNSRSKDFYDLYILFKTQLQNIDKNLLKIAFNETCKYRNFEIKKEEAFLLLNAIKSNKEINARWKNYCHTVKYTGDLSISETIDAINEWIKLVY